MPLGPKFPGDQPLVLFEIQPHPPGQATRSAAVLIAHTNDEGFVGFGLKLGFGSRVESEFLFRA